MRMILNSAMSCVLVLLIMVSALKAEEPSNTAFGGPMQQLVSGKKVFIVDGGTEASHCFSGGPDRHYRQFYAAMRSWGRYELVKKAADADLIFDIRLNAPAFKCALEGEKDRAAFNLAIFDSRNHVGLWALTEQVTPGSKQKHADENFDVAINRLVENVKQLVEQRQ